MTVKEPGFCFGLAVLGAMVGLPFTTTISQKKKIAGRIPRRGFYLLILVCFFISHLMFLLLITCIDYEFHGRDGSPDLKFPYE